MPDTISNWVRQARHRAKKHGCINRLYLSDILDILKAYNSQCAYCSSAAYSFDHAFLLSNRAPNVLANCLPACRECKEKKKGRDLVAYKQTIGDARFIELIRAMLSRDGADELRDHIRSVTGIGY